ncbi:MAG: DegT/DnrJ/EryC1/StrS family aminotransferase [Patescibacteria group bacterium]
MSIDRVPFVDLPRQYLGLREQLLDAIDRVCKSGAYVLGEDVKHFEEQIAAFCGTRYALGVANGSDALMLSLKALGIGPGDEVITAPNSFIASAWTVAAVGAKPVFADVGNDYNIDPTKVEAAITPRTRAVMPVHLTGRPARMDELLAICERRGLHLVEDAAQAIGARYKGKRTGSFGVTGCFSLHPLKNLHAYGDGGLITTNDQALYETLAKLRNHGLRNRDECDTWGYNSRLDSIQAAMLVIKLKHLDGWNERCRAIARRYQRALAHCMSVPQDRPEEEPVYHRFIVQVEERERLMQYLAANGVETKVNYPIPIHLQPIGRQLGHHEGDFPVAESQAKRIMSLPLYPEMSDEEVGFVIDRIERFYRKDGR